MKIIFTDLDESLLKENVYYKEALDKFIKILQSKNYIIVVITSKTSCEVEQLYNKNNIKFPFSAENGATFHMPFSNNKKDLTFKAEKNRNATSFNKILKILNSIPNRFLKNLIFIKDLSLQEQMQITKLKKNELKYFNSRNFSISCIWNGSDDLFSLFKTHIKKVGLQASFGGKMINISGVHNKFDALIYFKKKYLKEFKTNKSITISIGDSENDVEMLNYTDYSGIVIREDKRKINLIKNQKVFISSLSAPEGWVEVLKKITKDME